MISDLWVGGLIGVGGTILGAVVGYFLSLIPEAKRERRRRVERSAVIHAAFEGVVLKLMKAAYTAIGFHYTFMATSRRKELLEVSGVKSGDGWLRSVQIAKDNALLFSTAEEKYYEQLGQLRSLMVEFNLFLDNGEQLPEKNLANYTINRFSFVKKMSEAELAKADYSKEISGKYMQELTDCLKPISQLMRLRIEELKKKI